MNTEEKKKLETEKDYTINGVDKATLDKANSSFSVSDTQTQAQNKTNKQLSNYESIASKGNIVSNDVWGKINSTFQTPTAVTQADTYLKTQLSKIQSGKTSYSDQVKNMMSRISGREKFSYDVDNDPLFQQALASAMNSGKTAMQDAIGQASALTGGYGSSYATSAANQAYNSFVEDAYNNLPQHYQMALDAYNAEGDEMYRQLGMYQTADETEYSRMVNAYDATYAHRNQMYNEAYQQFRDSKSDAISGANLALSEHSQLSSDAFNLYNAYSNEADKMYEREYQSWADSIEQAWKTLGMQYDSYWDAKNFAEEQRQFDLNYNQAEDHFTRNLEHDSNENRLNREHQSSENQKNREHQSSENQKNREHQSSENQKNREHDTSERIASQEWQSSEAAKERSFTASENAKYKSGSKSGNNSTEEILKEIPSAIQAKAKTFKNNGDLEAYINSQVDRGAITEEQGVSLYETYASPEQSALNQREWTLVDNGGNNFFGGIDNNAKVKDQYGNEYRMDDLYDELKKTMSAKDAKEYVKNLQKSVGATKK